jgi:uncharacterized protein YjbI with pentapeptide repeats
LQFYNKNKQQQERKIVNKIILICATLVCIISNGKAGVLLTIQKSVTISWQGEIGKFYQVYQTTNMTDWLPVGSAIIGDTNMITRSYPSTNSSSFFKVEEITRPSLDHRLIYRSVLTNSALTQVSFHSDDIVLSDFTGSMMNVADLSDTVIDLCRFDRVDMRSSFLEGCPYICAYFNGAILWNTLFNGSKLSLCDFHYASFNYVNPDFQGATVYEGDFTGATGFNPAGGTFINCIAPDGSLFNYP